MQLRKNSINGYQGCDLDESDNSGTNGEGEWTPQPGAENGPEAVGLVGAEVGAGRGGDGAREREQWANPIEFLLSCIAMSVGLGNIWRFPFTAYENGGGAFLIPYIIVMFLIGKPVYFLELAVGQFSSRGHIKIWKMAPIFKGVGYGAAFATCAVISYYCSVMATTLFYFFASFNSRLPWTVCNDEWRGVTCGVNGTKAWVYKESFNVTSNRTLNFTEASIPELYYKNEVLKEKDSIDDGIGWPDWRLGLCLLAFWCIVFGSMVKGVRSSGKVAYFTALFPYAVLIVLLVKGVTLEGAVDGILYFITPQWEKLYEPKVWFAAIEQNFFSLSTGFGPVIMYASYNPFGHNVYRDAVILSFMDTFTSLLAGFTIFAILGHLSHVLKMDISEVSKGGSSLAFESYPLVISKFDFAPQVFAALFFLMLLTLGVGSTISDAGSIITVIHDQFPKFKKSLITVGVCAAGCLSGLLYITPGGQWMLDLVDYFACGLVIVVTATLEVIGIAWVYGLDNICRDIEFMLKRKIGWYWRICWGFIVPVGLSIILVGTLMDAGPPLHDDKDFPQAAIICGWILAAIGLLAIPICALHSIFTRKSPGIIDKFRESFKPSLDWGPRLPNLHQEWTKLAHHQRFWTKIGNYLTRMDPPQKTKPGLWAP